MQRSETLDLFPVGALVSLRRLGSVSSEKIVAQAGAVLKAGRVELRAGKSFAGEVRFADPEKIAPVHLEESQRT